jgi:hypothetical protein
MEKLTAKFIVGLIIGLIVLCLFQSSHAAAKKHSTVYVWSASEKALKLYMGSVTEGNLYFQYRAVGQGYRAKFEDGQIYLRYAVKAEPAGYPQSLHPGFLERLYESNYYLYIPINGQGRGWISGYEKHSGESPIVTKQYVKLRHENVCAKPLQSAVN